MKRLWILWLLSLFSPSLFSSSVQAKPFQLVTKEKEILLRKFLPKTDDKRLLKLYKKPLIFYTEEEMPSAFQHDGTVFSSYNNFSAAAPRFGGNEPYGNANREFPWGTPSGLHESKNYMTFKFVYLPSAISCWQEVLPIRPDTLRPRVHSYVWQYPVGTVFGEVLLVEDSKGYHETFELRTRTRKERGWKMNVYRPFPTPTDLVTTIQVLYPKYETKRALRKFVRHLEGKRVFHSSRLKNSHPTLIIESAALEDSLPELPEEVIRNLLRTSRFKSVAGIPWLTEGKKECSAPTTEAAFHIVPKGYLGSHIEVSNRSCMNCHNTCQMHVSDFQMFLPNSTAPRDWYGLVRGSDNIFSFHIFDKSCINFNDGSRPYPVKLNQDLIQAGLLEEKRRR